MEPLWNCLVVILCASVTSSRIVLHHGNERHFHDDDISDVSMERFSAPPTGNGLIIDYGGFHGNSRVTNDQRSTGTFTNHQNTPVTQIKVNKTADDKSEGEDICNELCRMGDGGNACMCDWPPFMKKFGRSLLKQKQKPTTEKKALADEWQRQKLSVQKTNVDICDTLCKLGDGGNACMCDWTP